MKQSAGTLLYRVVGGQVRVLIVHPAGRYNRNSPWSIPKGVAEPGESLEETARRETREETTLAPVGELRSLGYIDYSRSRKRVHGFACPAPEGEPRPQISECDRAEFFTLEDARARLHPDQRVFVDRLVKLLEEHPNHAPAPDNQTG